MTRRLVALTLEKRRLQSRLAIVEELEKELRTLLEGAAQSSFPSITEPPVPSIELVDEGKQGAAIKLFLQEEISKEPKTLDQLVAGARDRFEFGEKSVARTLHFHLLNLKNSGLIEKHGGIWRMADRPEGAS
jgi:hypothetical protein